MTTMTLAPGAPRVVEEGSTTSLMRETVSLWESRMCVRWREERERL